MTFEIVPMIVEYLPIELTVISNETDKRRYYIGVRSSAVLCELDTYMGTSKPLCGVDAGYSEQWMKIPDHWATD